MIRRPNLTIWQRFAQSNRQQALETPGGRRRGLVDCRQATPMLGAKAFEYADLSPRSECLCRIDHRSFYHGGTSESSESQSCACKVAMAVKDSQGGAVRYMCAQEWRSFEWVCNFDQFWRNISSIIAFWAPSPRFCASLCAPSFDPVARSGRFGEAQGGVQHGYKDQHLPSRRWYGSIKSTTQVGGTSARGRLRTRTAATAARRLVAAGDRAQFQNPREISRFPNCANSDEERHTNAAA